MPEKVQYVEKSVCGVVRLYPQDAKFAKALQLLNGHKSLTDEDITAFKLLGVKFEKVENK